MSHFISLDDWSDKNLRGLLRLAQRLKADYMAGGNDPILAGKILALVFEKPSLRTRVSYEIGMMHLGGKSLSLSPAEIGLGKRETVADVARVLSGYVDGVMARVFDHNSLLELAEHGSIPIINGLSDTHHPSQAIADALTILEAFDNPTGRTLTYVGDGNNVARSLLILSAVLGLNVRIAAPEGYHLSEEEMDLISERAERNGATFAPYVDPIEAVTGSDIVYTDVWTSMGQEAETAKRLQVFPPYQLNLDLMQHANADAVIMHCLPAHRGEEITDAAADAPNSLLFPQAHNRLHAQKAVLAHLLGGAVLE